MITYCLTKKVAGVAAAAKGALPAVRLRATEFGSPINTSSHKVHFRRNLRWCFRTFVGCFIDEK